METPDVPQPPTPPTAPPPATSDGETAVLTLHDLLASWEEGRRGERPEGLTASGATPICQRQTALLLHGTPPTDPVEPVTAATVGSLIHDAVARVWEAHDPEAVVEQRNAHGQADVVRPGDLEVRDLKTLNRTRFDLWAKEGPPDGVWNQLRIYAHDAGAGAGWLLVVDALDRDSGRCATYTRAYHPDDGERAVAALVELEADLLDLHPWHAEPDGSYGPDWVCQRCPFRTPCGREQEEHPYEHPEPALREAVEDFLAAKDMARAASDLRKRSQGVLRGIEGRVGDYLLKWTTRTMPEHYRPASEQTYLTVKPVKQ